MCRLAAELAVLRSGDAAHWRVCRRAAGAPAGQLSRTKLQRSASGTWPTASHEYLRTSGCGGEEESRAIGHRQAQHPRGRRSRRGRAEVPSGTKPDKPLGARRAERAGRRTCCSPLNCVSARLLACWRAPMAEAPSKRHSAISTAPRPFDVRAIIVFGLIYSLSPDISTGATATNAAFTHAVGWSRGQGGMPLGRVEPPRRPGAPLVGDFSSSSLELSVCDTARSARVSRSPTSRVSHRPRHAVFWRNMVQAINGVLIERSACRKKPRGPRRRSSLLTRSNMPAIAVTSP
jgi:hypothetical protein